MRKIKRYISRTIFGTISIVLMVIVCLDSISSLVDQLGEMKANYGFLDVLFTVFLEIPGSIYDFLPLSCLVGCLVGLGVLASTSELVVIRAAGVSVTQITWAVMRTALLFIVVSSAIGEFVSPYSNQYVDSYRALAKQEGSRMEVNQGHWNREGNEFMYFNAVLPNGQLLGITRHQFNDEGELVESSRVQSAIYQGNGSWFEENGAVTSFEGDKTERFTFSTRTWYTEVSPALLNVLVLNPEDLPMQRLRDQVDYLERQGLDAGEYQLSFWRKALQPFATASLVVIAISFILGPLRQTTMGFRVFVGVLVGLVFQFSQQLLAPASILLGFSPMYAVLAPIVISFSVGLLLIRRSQ